MTCFWNGILKSLDDNEIKSVLGVNRKPQPQEFVRLLKNKAVLTRDVKWNGNKLTNKEMNENLLRIKELNENSIGSCYDCSSCDPFLLLISQLFKVDIVHNFLQTPIKYTYVGNSKNQKTKKYFSNRGHFWCT